MNPEEREELASLYALDLLEGAELAAFERELAADPELAALVSQLEKASAQIALDVPRIPVPTALKDNLLREITARKQSAEPAAIVDHEATTSSSAALGWIPWALAAGMAVFAGLTWNAKSSISAANSELVKTGAIARAEVLALANRNETLARENAALTSLLTSLESERVRLEERVTALETEKNQLSVRVASLEARNPLEEIKAITLAPQPEAPKGGAVTALWDAKRQAGVLDLSKLPAAAAGKDYQLWIISPDAPAPISAGLISSGTPQAAFQSPRPLTQVGALAISLEPKGGSESPRGPVIYVGKL